MIHRKTLMAESYPSKDRGLNPVTLLYLFIALHVGNLWRNLLRTFWNEIKPWNNLVLK